MAFLKIVIPNRNIYTRTMLYGVGRAETDADLRKNLRLIAAVLITGWSDTTNPDLAGIVGEIFDVMTSPKFYEDGYNKTSKGNDTRLWFCSYVGFEKLTSKWAKETIPQCHGVICMRIYNQDAQQNPMDSHTVQIFY